jgi:hypothetical protein
MRDENRGRECNQFTDPDVRAFRYWIQGYPNFYEPLVSAYFTVQGYEVVAHPAIVRRPDIDRVVVNLRERHKRLGRDLDVQAVVRHLESRQRLQPDFLLRKEGEFYLAESKSWGGSGKGVFDLATARKEFIEDFRDGLFLLVDEWEGQPIQGKILVVSSCSPEAGPVEECLREAYQTTIEFLYLDDMFRHPAIQPAMEERLCFLDAAVQAIRDDLLPPTKGS